MKPITPRIHGVLDYASCALMLAAPTLFKLNPAATRLSYAFAASYLGVSGLTDYPLAVRRVIPFPLHGRIELSTVPALALAGLSQQGRERIYFLALAGTVLGAYSLTDWQAPSDS